MPDSFQPVHAEIIAIGDELTSGQRIDTNSQWISQQLGDLGIRTLFHTTVADDLHSNIAVFQNAARRADVVIATGGLGPTADDLTRQAMGEAFERPLELDHNSLQHIEQMFVRRGRVMPEKNRIQAMFPQGSLPIANPNGTAPGVDLQIGTPTSTCRLFALPGVPVEMKEMWQQSVYPSLVQHFSQRLKPLRHYRLKCFGIGESALEAQLPDLIRRGRTPSVGITVSKATITLRMSAQADSQAAFHELIAPTVHTIRETLGDFVFGEEDEELHDTVAKLLRSRKQTVAVSEWGSAGVLANWLQQAINKDSLAVAEQETNFAGGYVVNSVASANAALGISIPQEAEALAQVLATSAREKTDADYGLAVGPFPDNTDDGDAKVCLALASRDSVRVSSQRFVGHPEILVPRAAKQALNELRLHLLNGS